MSAEKDLFAEPIIVGEHTLKVRADQDAILFVHEGVDAKGINRLYPYSRREMIFLGGGEIPTGVLRVVRRLQNPALSGREWRPYNRVLAKYLDSTTS